MRVRGTGPGPFHLDLRRRLADEGRDWSRDNHLLRLVLGTRPRAVLQSPSLWRRRRADGRFSGNAALALTRGGDAGNISALFGGRRFGPTVDVGEFPHIFFLQRRCSPTRSSLLFATTSPASDSSWSISGAQEPWSAPSCKYGWTDRTASRAMASRPATVPGSAGPSSAFWNPGRWWAPVRARGSSPGIERPLRWPEHWRRFIGRRARVRAQALGGRRQVEMVGLSPANMVFACCLVAAAYCYDRLELIVACQGIGGVCLGKHQLVEIGHLLVRDEFAWHRRCQPVLGAELLDIGRRLLGAVAQLGDPVCSQIVARLVASKLASS